MQPKKSRAESDRRLLDRLDRHPHLKERFAAILELAESEGSELRTADEIETLLVEEVRRLGAQTMTAWARRAHQRVVEEVQQKEPSSYCGKKKL